MSAYIHKSKSERRAENMAAVDRLKALHRSIGMRPAAQITIRDGQPALRRQHKSQQQPQAMDRVGQLCRDLGRVRPEQIVVVVDPDFDRRDSPTAAL